MLTQLINLIERRKGEYVLFFGAGASVGSLNKKKNWNKIADEIIDDWDVDIDKELPANEKFEKIFKNCGSSERKDLIAENFKNMKSSEGYKLLYKLMANGYFDVIFTTNFDHMLEETFKNFVLNKDYVVEILEREEDQKKIKEKSLEILEILQNDKIEVKIVKLHGDLNHPRRLTLTDKDCESHKHLVKLVFGEYLNRNPQKGIIFVGYSGWDVDIAYALEEVEGNESVWYINPSEPKWNAPLTPFLNKRKAVSISGENGKFDNVFKELSRKLFKPTIENFFHKIELSDTRYRKIEDLYVKPREFDEIKEKLGNGRIVFIIGDPEIGKTYTSIKLLLDYYKKGYEPIYYKETARKEQLEILHYKHETILEGKKLIYFEDPFGKIKFEDVGGLFREFGAFIDGVRTSQSMIIITSREAMFKKFEEEKEFSGDIMQFVESLNLVKPSYDQYDLARMLEKAAKIYECKWFKNAQLRNFVSEYAINKLITPLRINEFIGSSKSLSNIDALKKEIDKKSKGTRISFAREINAMESSKILFLSLVYFDLPLDKVREYYQKLLDILNLEYLGNLFEDCMKWFVGNKVEAYDRYGEKYLRFFHSTYKEGLSSALDTARPKKIFSVVLKELVKDEDYYVRINVGETILENIDRVHKEVQYLVKELTNDIDPEVRERITYDIVENIHKFPSELREEEWVKRSIKHIEEIKRRKELEERYYRYELREEMWGAGMCEDCGNYSDNLVCVNNKYLCDNCRDN